MVKGVNKQIIEVNNPDSIYFERCIFYLKPGVRILPVELSDREITKIIAPYTSDRKKSFRLKLGRILITAVFLLVAASAIIAMTISK